MCAAKVFGLRHGPVKWPAESVQSCAGLLLPEHECLLLYVALPLPSHVVLLLQPTLCLVEMACNKGQAGGEFFTGNMLRVERGLDSSADTGLQVVGKKCCSLPEDTQDWPWLQLRGR